MAKFLDYDGLAYLWKKIKKEIELPGLETDEAIYTLFDTEVAEEQNQINFGEDCASYDESILTVEGAVVEDVLIVS